MFRLQDKTSIVSLLLLFVSVLFSYLVITPNDFPYLGIGITFITLGSLIFYFKQRKTLFHYLIYLLAVFFSFFIFYRVNSFLVFLNLVAVLYFGAWLILGWQDEISISTLVTAPLVALLQSVRIKSKFSLSLGSLMEKDRERSEKISGIIVSFLLSIIVLMVIVPLLSYANPFFEELVADLLKILNLKAIWERFLRENFFLYLIRGFVFLVLTYLLPRWLTRVSFPMKEAGEMKFSLDPIHLLIPKVVVGIVLLIFFITQARLYFSTESTLAALGYSHSQYAREVFAHLSVVALVIFALIYNDKRKDRWARILTYFLSIEAIFLNLVALKGVYDYSLNWGFTHKRLYGFTGVIWIFGLFGLFIYKYLKDPNDSYFIRWMVILSGLMLVGINILNFDYLIYHYAKSTTHEGVDHAYLSSLSTDARSYKNHTARLFSEIKAEEKVDTKEIYAASRLVAKMERLKEKYKNIDLRVFNFSEYFEYNRVKELDLEAHGQILDAKQIKPLLYPVVPDIRIGP